MPQNNNALPPPATRAILSLLLPLLVAAVVSAVVGLLPGAPDTTDPTDRAATSVLLAGVGVTTLLLGLYWYGLPALGLRGHRALYASIGFATLGWVVFFGARLFLVSSNPDVVIARDFGQTFFYLLLFEALAVQLWTFGLFFRSMADWRGPLAATITAGLLFGLVAYLFFEEALISSVTAVLYFILWGVFYALIRLRTGGILGIVIIQAMHSLTAWHILLPEQRPAIDELQNLYLAAGLLYLIFIWRLWPADEEDYRI